MDLIELQGMVKTVSPVEDISGGKYKKQFVVIDTTDGKYESMVAIEWFGDKGIEKLEQSGVASGDEAKVKFRVKSRESGGRYYTSADGVFIDVVASGAGATADVETEDLQDMPF